VSDVETPTHKWVEVLDWNGSGWWLIPTDQEIEDPLEAGMGPRPDFVVAEVYGVDEESIDLLEIPDEDAAKIRAGKCWCAVYCDNASDDEDEEREHWFASKEIAMHSAEDECLGRDGWTS
jgi:hypothetical protein